LHGGNEREMLPGSNSRPNSTRTKLTTYLTAAYWLRTSLNKPDKAEQFLREGLRANPGQLCDFCWNWAASMLTTGKNRVWPATFCCKPATNGASRTPPGAIQIPTPTRKSWGRLSVPTSALGDSKQELADLEELIKVARGKDVLQRQIDEVKAKLAGQKP
jgi:hypothetical protein